jgi:hypothetical protein
METPAATTRWAGRPLSLSAVRKLLDLRFSSIAVDEEVRGKELEEAQRLVPRRSLAALHLFAPLPDRLEPGAPPPFVLGALHPEKRRDALEQALLSLQAADDLEIPVVILPPAPMEEPSAAQALELLGRRAAAPLWEGLRRKRQDYAGRQLDSYLSTLSRLLDRAERYSLRLALTVGGLPSELPDLGEACRCLSEFQGGPLALWLDTVRGARYRETGGADGGLLLGDLAGKVAGVTVHDGNRRQGHLPLAGGEVDLGRWEELRRAAAQAVWAVDLTAEASEEELVATRDSLARFLAGPAAAPSGSILAP